MTQLAAFPDTKESRLRQAQISRGFLKNHSARIKNALHDLGAAPYDLLLPETRWLPLIINPGEIVKGIVYGRYKQKNGALVGRGALIATDKRVLLFDKKPLFVKCDEIAYRVISGIDYARVGTISTVTLATRMGDIKLRTFNRTCAHGFVKAVESMLFHPVKAFA